MGIPTFFNRMGGNSGPISPYDLLCFTANTDGSAVTLKKTGAPASGIVLQYSTNKSKWNPCIVDQQLNLRKGQKLYFKGDNETFNTANDRYSFTVSGSVKVGGNIMSLLDETCEETEVPSTAFYGLFQNSVGLTDASELTLPADVMTKECYAFMFDGCSSLGKAPELNSENLAEGCYKYMFRDCYALKKAPALPAPSLVSSCYYAMFESCSGLNDMNVGFFNWESNATDGWVNGVAATGTFRCPMTLSAAYGIDRIPTGWNKAETMAEPLAVIALGPNASPVLYYVGELQSVDNGHMEQGEGWEEPQESIYHPAETHWDEELQEEVVDAEEWWEDMPPIYHEGEETWISDYAAVPPYDLEYSTDGVTWQSAEFNPEMWDSTTGTNGGAGGSYTIPLINTGDVVYLRGNNTGFYTDANTHGNMQFGNYVNLSGNIMSLLDKTMQQTSVPANAFRGLFINTNLSSANDLYLPATELGGECYRGMFSNNYYLTTAPKSLPATTLSGTGCYMEMFKGCPALTKGPNVAATKGLTQEYSCYEMFADCTSLTKSPISVAPRTIPAWCFTYMLSGCTSLTGGMAITSDTIGNYGLRGLYAGCTSLTGHGRIGDADTTLGTNAMEYMFKDCTNFNLDYSEAGYLLPITGYSQSCYEGMFAGCTSLENMPHLPGAPAAYSFANMLSGCTGLKDASWGFGQSTTPAAHCYNRMFSGCTNLEHAPDINLTSLTNYTCFRMFDGCSKLKDVTVHFDAWDDENNATGNWMNGVAASGTFTCPSALDTTTKDASHVPDGWTVAAS